MLRRLATNILGAAVALLVAAAVFYPVFARPKMGGGPPPRGRAAARRAAHALRLYGYGQKALQAGDLPRAESNFHASLRVERESPLVWLALANLLYDQGRDRAALDAFREALLPHATVGPTTPGLLGSRVYERQEGLLHYALLCSKLGLLEEARSAVDRLVPNLSGEPGPLSQIAALERTHNLKTVAYLGIGVFRSRYGRYAEALDAYEEAARLSPNEGLPQYCIGLTLTRLHRAYDAEIAFTGAAALGPSDVRAAAQHAIRALQRDPSWHPKPNRAAHLPCAAAPGVGALRRSVRAWPNC